jgi:hypothetical protein
MTNLLPREKKASAPARKIREAVRKEEEMEGRREGGWGEKKEEEKDGGGESRSAEKGEGRGQEWKGEEEERGRK